MTLAALNKKQEVLTAHRFCLFVNKSISDTNVTRPNVTLSLVFSVWWPRKKKEIDEEMRQEADGVYLDDWFLE